MNVMPCAASRSMFGVAILPRCAAQAMHVAVAEVVAEDVDDVGFVGRPWPLGGVQRGQRQPPAGRGRIGNECLMAWLSWRASCPGEQGR